VTGDWWKLAKAATLGHGLLCACWWARSGAVSPSVGCKGHQTVALIAEKHLTPEGRQFVQKLLGDNPMDPS